MSPGTSRKWLLRGGAALFALALLYPFTAFLADVGPWQWNASIRGPALSSVRVSLSLTALAMAIIVCLERRLPPMSPDAARVSVWSGRQFCSCWKFLLPPLAMGILLTLAFGPAARLGQLLDHYGLLMTNSPLAFVATQVYIGMGYFVLEPSLPLTAFPSCWKSRRVCSGIRLFKFLCGSPCRSHDWVWPLLSASRGYEPLGSSALWWSRLITLLEFPFNCG